MPALPKLLDAFSGAGGAARGYQQAGWHVTGVDQVRQPRYAGDRFLIGDALYAIEKYGHKFQAIHASPPCQAYTNLRHRTGEEYDDLVAVTREALQSTGRPWVIENVPGSPLVKPLVLCGSMFGLGAGNRILKRHRWFESSASLIAPEPCCCYGKRIGGVYGTGGGGYQSRGYRFYSEDARQAMGIYWMNHYELSQAIPPAYTAWIGYQLPVG